MAKSPNFVYPDYGQELPCTHYAHRDFGNAVDANFISLSAPSWMPGSHSTVAGKVVAGKLVEDVPKAPTIFEFADVIHAAPELKRQHPDQPLILIGTHRMLGRGLYKFDHSSVKEWIRDYHRELEQWINKRYLDYCDGVIAVSDLIQNFIRIEAPHVATERVYPHIDEEFDRRLKQTSPRLDENHAITVCKARDHKGVDLLVEAWPAVRDIHPDATLSIIGKGHPSEYENTEGVTVHGFVDGLARMYGKASLYIHPARVDAFGVTVTEGMRSGLPALVTHSTGAKAVVQRLDDGLVVESRTNALAGGVIRYFHLNKKERSVLSDKSREIAQEYTFENQTKRFKEAYHRLIDRI